MAQTTQKQSQGSSIDEIQVVRQEGNRKRLSGLSNKAIGSFDVLSLVLVSIPLFGWFLGELGAIKIFGWPLGGLDAIETIALISAVFTLFSVRESKRDRETSVEPSLFIAKRQGGDYGIVNLGNGPAHEFSVKVTSSDSKGWEEVSEARNKLVRVDEFLPIFGEEKPAKVKLTYRTHVGYKEYNVVREVTEGDCA